MNLRKVLSVILIMVLAVALSACSKETAPAVKNDITETQNNTNKPQKEKTIPVLIDKEANQLETEAANRFMRITSGYFGPRLTKTDNPEFYYFPEELDSMEKLTVYLEQVLTTETVKKIIEPEYFKVINNKLAFKPQDYISEREWSKATSKVIYEKEDKKVYEYIVPSPGGEKETITIEFRYERNGWRINTPPYEFL